MSAGPTCDEILILRCIAFGESSKIVSALSARWGKVRLVAKGARSLRSKLAGLLEPGNEIEALFYPREGRDLWIISDGALRRAALTGASSLDKLSHLFAALELGDRLVPDIDSAVEFEGHFRKFLDRWHESGDAEMAALFFALELQVLSVSGWGFDTVFCAQCGKTLLVDDGGGRAYWSASEGHLTCARCAGHDGRWVDIEIVRALAAIDGSGPDAMGGPVQLTSAQRRGVGRLLHEHMSYHLPQYRLPKSLYWLQESQLGATAEVR